MTETNNNLVLFQNEIIVNPDNDFTIIQGECPYCKGLFAVDLTYIDQVDTVVHCPMCCMEVDFGEEIFEEE